MPYEENRVRVRNFGSLPSSSPLLERVSSVEGRSCRLHVLAAADFNRMAAAVKIDIGIDLAITSGWRPHRWKSREHYEDTLVRKYGEGGKLTREQAIREGKKWLAYNSPHETGLAMDIGVGGLWPDRKTAPAQREQPLHAWLVEHAWEYGWTPYKKEPWHWEHHVSREAWETGNL